MRIQRSEKAETYHETPDDVAASEAAPDFYAVLFCCADVLRANNAGELFACGEGDAVDDGDGYESLEGGEPGY